MIVLHPCLKAADRLRVDRDFLSARLHPKRHAASGECFHLRPKTSVFMPAIVETQPAQEIPDAAADLNFRAAGPHRFGAQMHQDQTRLCAVWHGSRYELAAPVKLPGGDLDSGCSAAALKTTGIGLGAWQPDLAQNRMQKFRAIGLRLDDVRRRVYQAALQWGQLDGGVCRS